ncbi:hypothetical protein KC906_04530 [Candidatus Kaiserbacteria bacterium]|nr:hypothetical protein [Candidatus Kaiserbacteria bacterium]
MKKFSLLTLALFLLLTSFTGVSAQDPLEDELQASPDVMREPASQPVEPPAFLDQIKTQADFDALTDEQKAELGAYYQATQPRPIVVATVEFNDLQIVSQNGQDVQAAFTIINGQGAQPDVRYRFDLYMIGGVDDRKIVDTYVFPETLSVSENESVTKTVSYTAPAYLSGTYGLQLTVETSAGLMLGTGPLKGTVELQGTSGYVDLTRSGCRLSVGGDEALYTTSQGVDLIPGETLSVTCLPTSYLGVPAELIPVMTVFKRTYMGDVVVPEKPLNEYSVAVPAAGSFEITLPVTTPQGAQAYDATLYFQNTAGERVSNFLPLHFVVQGLSGAIQNVVLDKDQYSVGENALVQVTWSGVAGYFANARHDSVTLEAPSVTVQIMNAAGAACTEEATVSLSGTRIVSSVSLPILKNCYNPTVSATLVDGDTVLDTKELAVNSTGEPPVEPAPVVESKPGSNGGPALVLLFLVVLIAVVVGVVYFKRKDTIPPAAGAALFVLGVAFSGLVVPAGEVEAVTYVFDGGASADYDTVTVTYNLLTGTSYTPGQEIQVSVSASRDTLNCDNGSETCQYLGQQAHLVDDYDNHYYYNTPNFTYNPPDPWRIGTYFSYTSRKPSWLPLDSSNYLDDQGCVNGELNLSVSGVLRNFYAPATPGVYTVIAENALPPAMFGEAIHSWYISVGGVAIPTGDISGIGCEIPAIDYRCKAENVTWSTNGLVTSPNVYNFTTNDDYSFAPSGDDDDEHWLEYGPNVIQLLDRPVVLDTVTLNAVCEPGTVWEPRDGGWCIKHYVRAFDCTILEGQSTCNANIWYAYVNPESGSPNLYNQTTVTQYSTSNFIGYNGTSQAYTYGDNTIQLRNGTNVVASDVGTASCASGLSWNGTVCAAASCTGSLPAFSTLYSGDNTGLVVNTPYSYASANTATKCQFSCNVGYVWNGTSCEAAACTGSLPTNSAMYSGDNTGLTAHTPYSYAAANTATKCQYACNTGFTWNGTSCVAQCTGTLPAFTTLYTGDNTGLSINTPYTYAAANTAAKCEYSCSSGYVWNGTSCAPATCTGTLPVNSTIYTGDNTGLTVNTPYTYATPNTTAKCEYSCNSGYTWDGANCNETLYPDLTANNLTPASGANFTPGANVTFTGQAVNSNVTTVAEGGWADLEIDWDRDGAGAQGTYDVNLNAYSGSMLGAFSQNQSKTLSYTYNNIPAGNHRYRFHVDTDGSGVEESDETNNRSAWVNFTVYAPPPTVSLEANGDAGSTNITEGGSVTLTWESEHTQNCTAPWMVTSAPAVQNLTGETKNGITANVTYTIQCLGDDGSTATDHVDVTVSLLPNLTVSLGAVTFPPAGFDPNTNTYQTVSTQYVVTNNGGEGVGESSILRIQFDLDNNGGPILIDNITIGNLAAGASTPLTPYTFSPTGGVPGSYGQHAVIATVDPGGVIDERDESVSDNTDTSIGATEYPDPGIELTANPTVVQTGATSTLTWDTKQPYDMVCTITGPGLTSGDNFNPSTDGTEGILYTNPITSKSTYLLRCVVGATGQTFTDTAAIETIGVIEEI